jgi:hypothetical protein
LQVTKGTFAGTTYLQYQPSYTQGPGTVPKAFDGWSHPPLNTAVDRREELNASELDAEYQANPSVFVMV